MNKYLFSLLLFLVSFVSFSQKGISYQAVILDPNKIEIPGQDITGQPYFNSEVWIKFQIFSGTSLQFEEVQKTQTDEYGLVNLLIGSVASTSFNSLIWDSTIKSMQVYVTFNQGVSYTKISDQKLSYIPYAFYADTAGKFSGILGISSGGTGAATVADAKQNFGLDQVNNTSDLSKPISTRTQDALDLKANKSDVISSLASKIDTGNLKAYVDSKIASINFPTYNQSPLITISDADPNTKGKIQLAGDLGGTASLPTVNSVGGVSSATIATLPTSIESNTASITVNSNTIANLTTKVNSNTSSITTEITRATNAEAALNTSLAANTTSITTNTLDILLRATILSPSFTGTPTAATASLGTNSTQLATTAFVAASVASIPNNAASDATANTKGILKLTNDLGGTANLPTVNSIGGVSSTTIATLPTAIASNTASITVNTNTIANLTTKVNSNTSSITAEITRATNAENALSSRITSNTISNSALFTTLVPYTGATSPVDLGEYDLTVNGIKVGSGLLGAYSDNLLLGRSALYSNSTGISNTAIGTSTLSSNISGNNNVAVGRDALLNSIGGGNTAVGTSALAQNGPTHNGLNNTAIGFYSDVSQFAMEDIVNATAIGFEARVLESNTIQLGNYNIVNVNTKGSITAGSVTYPNTDGVSGQVLTTNGTGVLGWTTPNSGGGTILDADATTKGKIQLTGDLGGSAALPTVNSIGGVSSATIATLPTAIESNTASITSILNTPKTYATLTGTIPTWNQNTTGNAATATSAGTASTSTKLTTARNINGVAFDGSADITVTADAGTLTGTTLKSTVTASSLTSVGTLVSLEVNGRATNSTAFNAASSTTIDFTKSNLAYTSNSPGPFILSGIKDGGTFTLAVQGTTADTSTFTSVGYTFLSVNNGLTTSGKHTLYTFIVMGFTVYYFMTTGF